MSAMAGFSSQHDTENRADGHFWPFADISLTLPGPILLSRGGHARSATFAQRKDLVCPTGAKPLPESKTEFLRLSNLVIGQRGSEISISLRLAGASALISSMEMATERI